MPRVGARSRLRQLLQGRMRAGALSRSRPHTQRLRRLATDVSQQSMRGRLGLGVVVGQRGGALLYGSSDVANRVTRYPMSATTLPTCHSQNAAEIARHISKTLAAASRFPRPGRRPCALFRAHSVRALTLDRVRALTLDRSAISVVLLVQRTIAGAVKLMTV